MLSDHHRQFEQSVHLGSVPRNPAKPGSSQGVSRGRYGRKSAESGTEPPTRATRRGGAMAALINSSPVLRERDLFGQTVMVIGGSSGIGLATARLARAKGANVILAARDPDRLHRVGLELEAS